MAKSYSTGPLGQVRVPLPEARVFGRLNCSAVNWSVSARVHPFASS